MAPPDLTTADLSPDGPVSVETWLGAPARSYPNRPRSILEILDRAVRLWPDAPAMLDELGAVASYAQFATRVGAAAGWLAAHGLRPGARVAVAGRNALDVAVLLFACAATGTVFVGLNPRLARDEWAYMLGRSRAALALGQSELLADLAAAAAQAGLPPERVLPLEPPN